MLVAVLMSAALAAGPAQCRIDKPVWARRPSGDMLDRYYPSKLSQVTVDGRTTMECVANANGDLADCRVLKEEPPGYGFGDAALKLARYFRLDLAATKHPRRKSVAGCLVSIPIIWKVG